MTSGIFNQITGYHNRRSIRLRDYDYSRPGAYFVTVCIHDRTQKLFGDVVDGKMVLNDAGKFARKCWADIPNHFPGVELDESVVMPNHVHGIIAIREISVGVPNSVGVQNFEPLQLNRKPYPPTNKYQRIIPRSIGTIVRGFKIGVTKWFRERSPNTVVWQRNYHDHIIRDEKSLFVIRKYVRDNPAQWAADTENHLNDEVGLI